MLAPNDFRKAEQAAFALSHAAHQPDHAAAMAAASAVRRLVQALQHASGYVNVRAGYELLHMAINSALVGGDRSFAEDLVGTHDLTRRPSEHAPLQRCAACRDGARRRLWRA